MSRLTVLCFGAVVSMAAHAQSSPTKIALAQKLVNLMQLDKLQTDYLKECGKTANSISIAATAFRQHPESFSGLSPKSLYWSEVEGVYAHYRARVCAYVTSKEIARFFVDAYSIKSTEEDLRAAIAFNSSAAGRRITAVAVDVNNSFQEFANTLALKATEQADDEYQKEIAKIVAQFNAQPQ